MIWILAKMKVEYICFSLISVLQYIPTDRSQYHFVSKCEEIFLFFLFLLISVWGVAKDNHMIRKSCLLFSEGKS